MKKEYRVEKRVNERRVNRKQLNIEKETNKKKIIRTIIVSLCFLCGVIGGVLFGKALFKFVPLFTDVTYELGEVNLSTELTDYVDASDFMLKRTTLDISQVVTDQVGDYEIVCTAGKRMYSYNVHIVDTTKPEISFGEVNKTFGTYNQYDLADLNVTASDLSEMEQLRLVSCEKDGQSISVENNSFCMEETGTYTMRVEVADIYGNVATETKSIEIVDAPHFILVSDRAYNLGTDFGPLDFAFAEDRFGNDISDEITLTNDSGYDANVEGSYDITYLVKDSDNIQREQSITINIGNYEQNNYGFALNEDTMNQLIEHDYFSYNPLEENVDNDFDQITDMTCTTSFGVKNVASSDRYSFFSCFIYKITPNYVYFLTNKHCTFNYSQTYIYDYMENEIYVPTSEIATISYFPNKSYYSNNSYDIRLFAVPIGYFSPDYLLHYKEVCIDWDVYEHLNVDDSYVVNTQAWGYYGRGYKDIVYVNSAYAFDESNHLSQQNSPLLFGRKHTLRGGQSGSPCFDNQGNLLGIAGWSIYDRSYSCYRDGVIRIEEIHEFFETEEFQNFISDLENGV